MVTRKVKLMELKAVQLREELDERSLDSTGVKSELQMKLRQALVNDGEDPEIFLFEVTGSANDICRVLKEELAEKFKALHDCLGNLEKKFSKTTDGITASVEASATGKISTEHPVTVQVEDLEMNVNCNNASTKNLEVQTETAKQCSSSGESDLASGSEGDWCSVDEQQQQQPQKQQSGTDKVESRKENGTGSPVGKGDGVGGLCMVDQKQHQQQQPAQLLQQVRRQQQERNQSDIGKVQCKVEIDGKRITGSVPGTGSDGAGSENVVSGVRAKRDSSRRHSRSKQINRHAAVTTAPGAMDKPGLKGAVVPKQLINVNGVVRDTNATTVTQRSTTQHRVVFLAASEGPGPPSSSATKLNWPPPRPARAITQSSVEKCVPTKVPMIFVPSVAVSDNRCSSPPPTKKLETSQVSK